MAVESAAIVIRLATPEDLPALGRLGAQLVELHYAIDDRRFMRAGGGLADGYARFLGAQLKNADAVVLAAEHEGRVVGTTTSAGYGHTLGRTIALGYLPAELGDVSELEIEAFLVRHQAARGPRVLYDPKGLRLKA